MHELSRPAALRREELEQGAYFEALLQAGLARGLIDAAFVERLQMNCMELLALACRRYTGGQSTSLPREQAEDILQSIVFTLGVWLKDYPQPEDALAALGSGPAALAEGLEAGLRRVRIKARATRQFYGLAQKRRLDTDNYLYNATVLGGIPGFFKLYEPRFGSHRIHITADYPLLMPLTGFQGIEFIQLYAQRLDYENRFCRAFPARAAKAALTRHAIEYDTTVENLHANLCGVILQAALACALCECPLQGLVLSPTGRKRLSRMLAAGEAQALLPPALEAVLAQIRPDAGTTAYLREALWANLAELVDEMALLTREEA